MTVSIVDEYRRQIQILSTMCQESQRVRSYFDAARSEYRQQIERSRQLGFMGDYVDQLAQRHQEFSGQMDELLEFMLRGEMAAGEQEQRLHGLIRDAQTHD